MPTIIAVATHKGGTGNYVDSLICTRRFAIF